MSDLRVIFEPEPKDHCHVDYTGDPNTREAVLSPLTEREKIALLGIVTALRRLSEYPQDTHLVANPLLKAYTDVTGRHYLNDLKLWE